MYIYIYDFLFSLSIYLYLYLYLYLSLSLYIYIYIYIYRSTHTLRVRGCPGLQASKLQIGRFVVLCFQALVFSDWDLRLSSRGIKSHS